MSSSKGLEQSLEHLEETIANTLKLLHERLEKLESAKQNTTTVKIYKVKCNFCRELLGHVITDIHASQETAYNEAHATFHDIAHKCPYKKEVYERLGLKRTTLIVELLK